MELALAGGLCGAAGGVVAVLLWGRGSPAASAWAAGLGALAVALMLAVPLSFRAVAAYQQELEAIALGLQRWADGSMTGRMTAREPGLGSLAQACNALADSVEARLRAQRQLADTNAELARQSAVLAALQERQRIARDLHDAVSQRLFGIHLLASAAARQPGAAEAVRELEDLSREAQREMRALLLQLRPPALASRPLAEALTGLCREAERLGSPRWRLEVEALPPLGPAVEDGLFRIAQEAVANVRRHAGAAHAVLSLWAADGRVVMAVDDDGHGFDASAPGSGGMGLRGMGERAGALGGVLRVKSQPGRGTRIEVDVPHLAEAGG